MNNKIIVCYPFSEIEMIETGLVFYSKKRHRIFIGTTEILYLNNNVYLKLKNRIVIKNVYDVFIKNKYLYFKGNGRVEVCFDCLKVYKYFQIDVFSKQFSLIKLKQQSLINLIKNLTNFKKCNIFSRYLNILIKILKISFNKNEIHISKNKYNIDFSVRYKNGKKIKQINIKS